MSRRLNLDTGSASTLLNGWKYSRAVVIMSRPGLCTSGVTREPVGGVRKRARRSCQFQGDIRAHPLAARGRTGNLQHHVLVQVHEPAGVKLGVLLQCQQPLAPLRLPLRLWHLKDVVQLQHAR